MVTISKLMKDGLALTNPAIFISNIHAPEHIPIVRVDNSILNLVIFIFTFCDILLNYNYLTMVIVSTLCIYVDPMLYSNTYIIIYRLIPLMNTIQPSLLYLLSGFIFQYVITRSMIL